MIRRTAHGMAFYQFDTLLRHPGLTHAVFTRLGGVSSGPFSGLNVGHCLGDNPQAADANLHLLLSALLIPETHVVSPQQVHGVNVVGVGTQHRGTTIPSTDSLFTAESSVALLLRFADCVPVFLYDARRHVGALAHAGWRGVAAGVVTNTIAAMGRDLGCVPSDMIACLGPAIGPCCYTVGPDVAAQVTHGVALHSGPLSSNQREGVQLDLPAAVRLQLLRAGVQHVEQSGLCTSCHTDEFFSHRAEGGRTGRFAALLMLHHPGAPAGTVAKQAMPRDCAPGVQISGPQRNIGEGLLPTWPAASEAAHWPSASDWPLGNSPARPQSW
jgi:YfiH family protein